MRNPDGTITEEREGPGTGKIGDVTLGMEIDARSPSGIPTGVAENVPMEGRVREGLKAALGPTEPETVAEPAPQAPEKRELSPEQTEAVIRMLKTRFEAEENKGLCPKLDWRRAEKALRATPKALWSVSEAERNGHEPAISFSDDTGFDIGTLAKETPQSTRNCVYDKEAGRLLREQCPDEQFNGSAEAQAEAIGMDIMTVELAEHIAQNTPTYYEQGWRWYKTPENIRKIGRALCGNNRHGLYLAVDRDCVLYHDDRGGWGGSLRVNFVD